jgi:hypothetical protein
MRIDIEVDTPLDCSRIFAKLQKLLKTFYKKFTKGTEKTKKLDTESHLANKKVSAQNDISRGLIVLCEI